MNDVNALSTIDSNDFTMKKIITLIICIAVPVGVGLLSGYITRDNMMVFNSINKPMFTPPPMVFPIAWTILYILMGLASYAAIINCRDGHQAVYIMYPYVIQLILNFMWSIIFFNAQLYGVAFVCLVFMWIMILRTMTFFGTVSLSSYYLLTPYLLWVTFAGYLNLSIVMIN